MCEVRWQSVDDGRTPTGTCGGRRRRLRSLKGPPRLKDGRGRLHGRLADSGLLNSRDLLHWSPLATDDVTESGVSLNLRGRNVAVATCFCWILHVSHWEHLGIDASYWGHLVSGAYESKPALEVRRFDALCFQEEVGEVFSGKVNASYLTYLLSPPKPQRLQPCRTKTERTLTCTFRANARGPTG